MDSRNFQRAILDYHGVTAELESPFDNNSDFKKNGYICEEYSDYLNKYILKFFDNTLIDKFKQNDFSDNFYCGIKEGETKSNRIATHHDTREVDWECDAYGENTRGTFVMKIYLDMDGVLADFFKGFANHFGKDHWKQIQNKEKSIQ